MLSGARCFRFSRSGGGGEGSPELLSALGRSGQLEASDFGHIGLGRLREENHASTRFRFCFYDLRATARLFFSGGRQELNFDEREDIIPDAAWKLLADGTWPRLRVANGVPEQHLQRLRKASLDHEARAGGWSVGIRALGPTSFCLCLRLWVPPRRSSDLQLTERPRSPCQLLAHAKTEWECRAWMHGGRDGWPRGCPSGAMQPVLTRSSCYAMVSIQERANVL